MTVTTIIIQSEPFDVARETDLLRGENLSIGAIVTFVGLVRDMNEGVTVQGLTLEHYPGMAEKAIKQIVREACRRWSVETVKVVHRVGKLQPSDPIVYVGVASQHRGDAFAACEFIMDFLKVQAPFWKKEKTRNQDRWLEARTSDQASLQKWLK